MKKEKKKRKVKKIYFIPLILCIIAAAFIYGKGKIEYNQVKKKSVKIVKTDEMDKKDEADKETKNEKYIDFKSLKNINEDIVAWVVVPDTNIDYPVCYKKADNDTYLHKDIYQKYLYAGAIFVDGYMDSSFTRNNLVLYGHNMQDMSMFASLRKFRDKSFYNSCKYFYIYTTNDDLKCIKHTYKIFNFMKTTTDNAIYKTISFDEEDFEKNKELNKKYSINNTETEVKYTNKIVNLSTCTSVLENERYVLQGVEVKKEIIK